MSKAIRSLITAALVVGITVPALAWTPRYMPSQPPAEYLAAGYALEEAELVKWEWTTLGQLNADCLGGEYNTVTSIRTACTFYPDMPGNPNPGFYTGIYAAGTDIPAWYVRGLKDHERGHMGAHALGREWDC